MRGAYLHDLKGTRQRIEIDTVTIASAERKVAEAAHKIRNREFEPSPGGAMPHVRRPHHLQREAPVDAENRPTQPVLGFHLDWFGSGQLRISASGWTRPS